MRAMAELDLECSFNIEFYGNVWQCNHSEAQWSRGIPMPEEQWAEVVKLARIEGTGTRARALRLDRVRLEARMAMDRVQSRHGIPTGRLESTIYR
jgi:hypothetical protein